MSYLWCLHCECVFPKKQWMAAGIKSALKEHRQDIKDMIEKYGECPNCSASGLKDGWRWRQIAVPNGYPDKPESGAHYPMYPPKVP